MGRFDTLMYDNRNWKGSLALVASMLIGLSVGFKGFDELPDLQNDRRSATVALYKAKRVFDKQVVATPAYAKAQEMVKDADDRVGSDGGGFLVGGPVVRHKDRAGDGKRLDFSWRCARGAVTMNQSPSRSRSSLGWSQRPILVPVQAVLRFFAGDTRGFDRAIGSLRVVDEIAQAGVEMADVP